MKTIKNISLSILIAVILTVTGCSNDELVKQQKAKADAELAAMQHERDSVQAIFEITLADINASLTSIFDKNNADKNVAKKSANKSEILKNIQLADEAIQKNKKRISTLKSQLSKYKIDNASLNKQLEEASIKLQQFETQLASLQEQVKNKDVQIAELNRQAENLKLENVMQKEFADKFEADLNTAYYTTGTHKELVKTGVLDSKGGILGIGSTEVLKDNFPDQMFAKIDIRKNTSIPVNAKKVKLITNHPESSYELKENNGLIASLEIKDPSAFWKTSKHMVLEVR